MRLAHFKKFRTKGRLFICDRWTCMRDFYFILLIYLLDEITHRIIIIGYEMIILHEKTWVCSIFLRSFNQFIINNMCGNAWFTCIFQNVQAMQWRHGITSSQIIDVIRFSTSVTLIIIVIHTFCIKTFMIEKKIFFLLFRIRLLILLHYLWTEMTFKEGWPLKTLRITRWWSANQCCFFFFVLS